MASIAPRRPLSAATLADLDDDAVQDIDQFVLRFGKLQDVLGTRLFPALLDALQEPYEDRPMLDKLNRLEKLGLLESAEAWEKLRALRNHIHLLPSPKGRGSQALLPSPPGRGAGGEGTTLATNCTQPEPSPQPSPKGRGSQDSALTRHPFLQAGGSQTPAFRPRRS